MKEEAVRSVTVKRMAQNRSASLQDLLAVEEPLEIRLQFKEAGQAVKRSISVTMRTPGNDFELAAGFLFTEGIIKDFSEIEKIDYEPSARKPAQSCNLVTVSLRPGTRFDPELLVRHFYTTSSCGVCGKASIEALRIKTCPQLPSDQPSLRRDVLCRLPERLRQAQTVFEKTGGLHAAALFDASGNLIGLREDVGRHNAVDKLVGEQLMAGRVPLQAFLMMVSGRSSFEIMQKALAASIPFVVAVGAPSSLAVQVAQRFNMTLVGFARAAGFNIYSGAQRVR